MADKSKIQQALNDVAQALKDVQQAIDTGGDAGPEEEAPTLWAVAIAVATLTPATPRGIECVQDTHLFVVPAQTSIEAHALGHKLATEKYGTRENCMVQVSAIDISMVSDIDGLSLD